MADSTSQEGGEQPGSPLEFKERLSIRQVEELGITLQKHEGELCLCALEHSYTVEERNPFFHGGRKTWSIMAPEQEFTVRRVVEAQLLVWKANDQRPEPRSDGLLVIPTGRHLSSSSRGWPWSVLGVWEFERIEGPIQHELLKNEPFDLHPELPIPPSVATSSDPLSLLQILTGLRGRGEKRTSDHKTKTVFFFGDQPVYERVFGESLREHAPSRPALAIQFLEDIEFLEATVPPELLELAETSRKQIRIALLRKALEYLAQGKPLDELAKEYRRVVGGNLKSTTLSQLLKYLAETEEDVP